MSADDKTPVTATSLKPMDLVLVLKDGRPSFQLLGLFTPLDEAILLELLDGEVDRLGEARLRESNLRTHVKNKRHVFMIIHIAYLLSRGDTNRKGLLDVQELRKALQNRIFLNSLKFSV